MTRLGGLVIVILAGPPSWSCSSSLLPRLEGFDFGDTISISEIFSQILLDFIPDVILVARGREYVFLGGSGPIRLNANLNVAYTLSSKLAL